MPPGGSQPDLARLADDYELLHELGAGGMAAVYLAREHITERLVAIKVLRGHYESDQEALSRFAREARTLALFDHPNIVRTYAVRRLGEQTLAIVMGYVPGDTLRQVLRARGALHIEAAEHVLRSVAEALGYAHEHGIVHRDVKPENIFLEKGSGRALLSDFGLARPIDADTELTMAGTALGTPTYMSPEQIDGSAVDRRSDIYSLGLVGWEMLTGRRPWEGHNLYSVIYKQKHEELPSLTDLRPDAPPGLRLAIEGALRKAPGERWASADEFLARLGAADSAAPDVAAQSAVPAATLPSESNVPDVPTLRFRRPDVSADVAPATLASEPSNLPAPQAPAESEHEVTHDGAIEEPGAQPSPAEHATQAVTETPAFGDRRGEPPSDESTRGAAPTPDATTQLEPTAREVAVDQAVAAEPAAREPLVGRSSAGGPSVDEPMVPPVVDQPAIDHIDQPAGGEPGEPAVDEPPAVRWADDERETHEAEAPPLAWREPHTRKPETHEPVSYEPASYEPVPYEPVPYEAVSSDADVDALAAELYPRRSVLRLAVAVGLPVALGVALALALMDGDRPVGDDSTAVAVATSSRAGALDTAPERRQARESDAPTPAPRTAGRPVVDAPGRTGPAASRGDSLARCSSAAATDQRACLFAHIGRNDAELNRVYRELLVALRREAGVASGGPDPDAVQRLRREQRSWLTERDAECRRRGRGQEGPLWAPVRARCFAEFSDQRAAELAQQLRRLGGRG